MMIGTFLSVMGGTRFGCHGEPPRVASLVGVTEIARLVAASARALVSCDDVTGEYLTTLALIKNLR